jgi:hypothetical protein
MADVTAEYEKEYGCKPMEDVLVEAEGAAR